MIDVSPDKERMKSLLKYLQQQKKGAHMRTCNYNKKRNGRSKDEDLVSTEGNINSSSTISEGGRRGGGHGRGKGRGGTGWIWTWLSG